MYIYVYININITISMIRFLKNEKKTFGWERVNLCNFKGTLMRI